MHRLEEARAIVVDDLIEEGGRLPEQVVGLETKDLRDAFADIDELKAAFRRMHDSEQHRLRQLVADDVEELVALAQRLVDLLERRSGRAQPGDVLYDRVDADDAILLIVHRRIAAQPGPHGIRLRVGRADELDIELRLPAGEHPSICWFDQRSELRNHVPQRPPDVRGRRPAVGLSQLIVDADVAQVAIDATEPDRHRRIDVP